MAKIPYRKLPKKLVAGAALTALIGVAAAQLTTTLVADYEGYVPEGYRDPVGIPTKCFGDTRDVVVGKKYSFEECVRSLDEHLYEIALPIFRCVSDLDKAPDKVKAAFISMAYNIGPGAFCKSSIAKMWNRGERYGSCRRMAEIYKTARGKELPGLVRRRAEESQLCLQGLEEEKYAVPVE